MSEAKKQAGSEKSMNETTYEISVLRKKSVDLFGVSTAAFDGAMRTHKDPVSVGEAKKIIEDWKKGVAK